METSTIKQISQQIKSKDTRSVGPLEQSPEEGNLQFMHRSLPSLKNTSISLPPNTPHEAMRDHSHTPNHCRFMPVKLASPT